SARPSSFAAQQTNQNLGEITSLEADLTTTRLALDIMGKAHALLEELSESAGNDEPPTTS
ncbi:hypothetical protein, partial [Kibdelosporangium philippinense]|uniref:hypothetical protein n=1 Tax=Kibdelosporangium philippinense TaxID=211113 RepID=UPI0035E79B8F